MIPLLEPTVLFAPLAGAVAWLGAIAVAGAVVVVGLVAWTSRPVRPSRATVTPLSPRLPKAA
jgi:hypothetical protein